MLGEACGLGCVAGCGVDQGKWLGVCTFGSAAFGDLCLLGDLLFVDPETTLIGDAARWI